MEKAFPLTFPPPPLTTPVESPLLPFPFPLLLLNHYHSR